MRHLDPGIHGRSLFFLHSVPGLLWSSKAAWNFTLALNVVPRRTENSVSNSAGHVLAQNQQPLWKSWKAAQGSLERLSLEGPGMSYESSWMHSRKQHFIIIWALGVFQWHSFQWPLPCWHSVIQLDSLLPTLCAGYGGRRKRHQSIRSEWKCLAPGIWAV